MHIYKVTGPSQAANNNKQQATRATPKQHKLKLKH